MLRSLIKPIFLVFLLAYSGINLHAQSTSNRGKDFWVAYTGHIDGTISRMTLFLTSDVNTTYQVKLRGAVLFSGTIQANVVTPVFINPSIYNVLISSSEVKEVNKAINVTAADPIALYSVISNNARTGSTLVLPTSTLGKEYYVFSQQSTPVGSNSYSQFCVVGVQDNTVIEINPTQSSRSGAHAAQVPFQITLNKGDVYQYQSQFDLTGTSVKTINNCSSFALYSGSTWTGFCEDGNPTQFPNGGDNLYQQLFPVTAWGRNFLTAPFFNTLNGAYEMIRIIVSEDQTTLTVNGSTSTVNGVNLDNPYKKGSVVTFFTNTANYIQSSAPIAVAQYQTSQNCNTANAFVVNFPGDPEMTILNPVEQTLKDITVYSKLNSVAGVNTNIQRYYLNVIAKTDEINAFTLDGQAITGRFVPIQNTPFSYAVVDVTNSTAQHRLKSTSGFSAIAYGYGNVESYAYLAGTDLRNLKTNLKFYNVGDGSIPKSSFCLGAGFDVVLQLPYITSKITWILKDGFKTEVEDQPAYTSTVIDGETFYLYKHTVSAADLAQAGNYNFKAVVVKPLNADCASKDEEVFSSFDIFVPNFTYTVSTPQACVNASVTFNNTSPSSGGNFTAVKWDFGDGTTAAVENPLHFYKTTGQKLVTFTVTSELGCTLSVSKTIEIVKAPMSAFDVTPQCINVPIQFKDQSSTSNGTIVSWKWDFGDQTFSNIPSPTHTYTKSDTFTVSLITTSSGGCADTLKKAIYVNPLPEISFNDPGSCVDDVVQFEGLVLQGDVVNWDWTFGDGVVDLNEKNKRNPKHKFAQPGIYKITVTGTSSTGCQQTYAATVSINGINPVPSFDVADQDFLCSDKGVTFKNNSSVSFGKIVKIEWIFDYQPGGQNIKETDLNPIIGKTYTHNYPVSAVDRKYQVVLIAYTGQNCFTQSQPREITVHATPEITFTSPGLLCDDMPAFALTASVQPGISGTGTYSGKGVTSDGVFSPKLAGVGNWPISYVFKSDFSCTMQQTVTIQVNPAPVLTMPADANILRLGQVQLNAVGKGDNLKYKWVPSEGLSADSIPNPIANPSKTTRYTLTLTALNCSQTGEVSVIVHENPNIPNAFSPNGDQKNDTWSIKYLESFVDASIVIFNRHGQKIFASGQYNTPWDGRFNGQDVPVGVYYYIIEPNNGREKFTGSVTVLR